MTDLPTLGPAAPQRFFPGLVVCAAIAGVSGGAVYLWQHQSAASQPAAAIATVPDQALAVVPAVAPVVAPPLEAAAPLENPTPAPATKVDSAPALADARAGLQSVSVRIDGALETAIVAKVGKSVGAPLTQVIKRALVWWASIPGDLVRGDTVSALYEERDRGEPVVHAVVFRSARFDKTFSAYRYQKPGDAFARFYTPEGGELEQRLDHGPLDSWEQITSLLKDGRKHHGVDFKTPVGTPVKAPFDGIIERKNWSFRGNGNCLELAEAGGQGRRALFLHLSELPKNLEAGKRVRRGDVIAASGNSGRSFAAHLHYQLMRGEKVVDPFTSHTTHRAALSESDLPSFREAMARLEQKLPASTLASR